MPLSSSSAPTPPRRRASSRHGRTAGQAGRGVTTRDGEGDKAMNERPRVGPDKVGPEDPRYADLVRRGFNKRFAGKPDYVRLVGSTAQVVDAVQDAVREKLRV